MTLPIPALLLTLGAAIAWSAFDAARKVLANEMRPVPLAAALSWLQTPIFLIWLFVEGSWYIDSEYALSGIAVFGANITASVLFFEALRRSSLSLTVPLLSLSPVITALLGNGLLDEHLTPSQWSGVGLVVLGAMTLNTRGTDFWRPDQMILGMFRESGSLIMIAVAACWATTTVFDKIALQHVSIPMHVSIQTLALAAALTIWLLWTRQASDILRVRTMPGAFYGGVVVSCVALTLQLHAIQLLPVGIMEAIKRTCGIFFAIGIGRVFFGEDLTSGKIAAGVLMSIGVVLLGT